MEKNEVIIGREVGRDDYLIEKQYTLVGRKHARIIREPDGIYIEDLDSSNGTFVNGVSVSKKKIDTSDKITLGGVDYYALYLEKALNRLSMTDKEFQTNFIKLKQVYENFQIESNRLNTKGQEDMMTKRFLPTTISGIFTGIITLLAGNNLTEKLFIAIIGGILSVAVFLVANKMASKSAKKMRDQLALLDKNFELDYICPDCRISFKGRSWEYLKRGGKCPVCKREFCVN